MELDHQRGLSRLRRSKVYEAHSLPLAYVSMLVAELARVREPEGWDALRPRFCVPSMLERVPLGSITTGKYLKDRLGKGLLSELQVPEVAGHGRAPTEETALAPSTVRSVSLPLLAFYLIQLTIAVGQR